MTDSKSKSSVLILLSTGKLGSGVVDAFQSTGDFRVYGTTRNAQNPVLLSKQVTPVAFQYGNRSSIEQALEISHPHVVVVITHTLHSKSAKAEVEHGKIILDACRHRKQVPHVILTSTDLADIAPKKAGHLSSKKELEVYIQGLNLPCYSILRSSSFMENFDDPSVHNPLCRGALKDLYEGWVQVNHVATLDVGKAAVAMSNDPKKWNGKTLTCIASRDTGDDLSKVLSEVSGLPCIYQATPPRFVLRFLLSGLYHMVDLQTTSSSADWSKEMNEFKAVVPDIMTFRKWLTTQQKGWSDGTLFGEPAPPKRYLGGVIIMVVGAVIMGAIIRRVI